MKNRDNLASSVKKGRMKNGYVTWKKLHRKHGRMRRKQREDEEGVPGYVKVMRQYKQWKCLVHVEINDSKGMYLLISMSSDEGINGNKQEFV